MQQSPVQFTTTVECLMTGGAGGEGKAEKGEERGEEERAGEECHQHKAQPLRHGATGNRGSEGKEKSYRLRGTSWQAWRRLS